MVKEYEKGDTARFDVVFKDENDNVIEPDIKGTGSDHVVDIEIKESETGDLIVSTTDMTELSDTEFRYDWQTTEGMNTGEYEVEVGGEFNSDRAVERDRVKLVDII